ncbi:hypothetical protein KKH18_05830, partial [bacterium]|nr:hypothetical protein [bacterium]
MPSIRFYKLRGRMLFRPLFLLLAFMLWFEGCTLPKEPGSLWWDIDLIVPMGERTYGIWDLTDPDSVLRANSSGIGMDADSNAYFSLWTETSVAIEDCLYFQPLEFEIQRPIDAIQVPINLDSVFYYSLGSLNPEIAALHDATLEIEPHLLEATQTFTANELIVSAQTDTGTARLVLINGLPYAVENLEIIFGTAFLSGVITEIGSIAAGEQIVLNCDLREAHLSTTCLFKVRGTGTGGASVSIDSTDHITLAVQIDTVTSDLYEGRFPEQLLYGDTAIMIENQHLIEFATIRSGSMRIELSNQTQVDDTLLMVLPNLVNQLDDSVVVSRFVPAGAIDSSTLDLEGYRIRLTGTEPQLFEGRIIIHSQQTVDDREFDAGSEYASARLTLSRLRFDFFRGTLRDMMLPVPLTEIPVERPPNGWETVHPTQADAYVHFAETFGGEGYVNLNLQTLYNGDQIGESEI